MVSKCTNCGKDVRDEEATYCPYCAKPLRELFQKRTGFPIASGILAIIAACVSTIFGIGFYAFLNVLGYSSSYGPQWGYLLGGIFGIIGFAFGLMGGIMALRRKHFVLSIIGICLTIVGGLVGILGFFNVRYGSSGFALVFGIPVVVLSALSLIFIAISKKEFA